VSVSATCALAPEPGRPGVGSAPGVPDLLQIAVAYADLGESCARLVRPPLPIQKIVLTPLVPLARRLGRRAAYRAYSPDYHGAA